ncbi:hypothetical protein HPB47_007881 [Ixodes persulcatus]|uniref:Uncharacterized protein n=1 Tax=Ixodes persulcatus TaxID=34615 RepID=A0AC60P754_IXOPE|nr:hypothetical protein HPB47_007881 [Ixodes persulcatus]
MFQKPTRVQKVLQAWWSGIAASHSKKSRTMNWPPINFRSFFVLIVASNILVVLRFGLFTKTAGSYLVVFPSEDLPSVNRLAPRINTSGCMMPQFDPFDPSVKKHFKKANGKACPGNPNFISTRSRRNRLVPGVLQSHWYCAVLTGYKPVPQFQTQVELPGSSKFQWLRRATLPEPLGSGMR